MLSIPAAAAGSQNVVIPFIPELTDPNFLDILVPARGNITQAGTLVQDGRTEVPTNPLMEALKVASHRTVTENNANTYASTLDPVLDAFFGMKPTEGLRRRYHARVATTSRIVNLLEKSWAKDPESTLKIIWNTRSIHDGKGEKEIFYHAWGWLYEHHPRTAIENLHLLVQPVCKINKGKDLASHGYWKDLLNLVCLSALDQLKFCDTPRGSSFLHCPRQWASEEEPLKMTTEEAVANDQKAKEAAKTRRAQRYTRLHHDIATKLSADLTFRALYIAVARLFADQLVKDTLLLDRIAALPAGDQSREERKSLSRQISLAGKWAPTPGATHDRHSNLGTAIAMLIHFSQAFLSPSGLSITPGTTVPMPPVEAHILRSFYQRWILRPLRAHIQCPEPLMSANRWKEIRYTRVPSVCMQTNMPHFYVHDPERFEEYLAKVETGAKKISGATLMPHAILRTAMEVQDDIENPAFLKGKKISGSTSAKIREMRMKLLAANARTVEVQWKTMLERVKAAGKLENSLAVCDVSGSMGHLHSPRGGSEVQPILPAVALSIVVAQTASPPFNNGFITFSSRPEFIQIDPSLGLAEMATSMVSSAWEMNTDFEAVFLKLLLPLAQKNQVKPEDMVKRLFVFSDMQFDQSRKNDYIDWSTGYSRPRSPPDWETSHDVIESAYREAGYEVPEIVYWNLASWVQYAPVMADKKGVALMSGFSSAMLKVFMEEEDIEEEDADWDKMGEDDDERNGGDQKEKSPFNPVEMMMKVLGRESFSGLVVVD